MLAVMGLMVGFYIITRMLELIFDRATKPASTLLVIMGAVTILATLAAMAYFVAGPQPFKNLPGLE
jgi:TRAP-type uncharacterized transport system fused permease subunit